MSYIGNEPTSVSFLTDTFSGNGSTTAFTMQVAPATTSSVLVAITGVVQDPSTYSVIGTTLTFSAAPPTGTNNISVRYLGIPASGVTTTAYRTVTEFTATAGQTTFSVPSYTVGYLDVYRSGSQLGSADFTASNGTTVVLAAGASAGELVRIVSFYVSSVLNAIPATAGAVNTTYITDGAVTTAKVADANVTQAKLATNVAGTGPAFSAYQSSAQTLSSATATKITFTSSDFDTTSGMFASSRFTPTVAGYYQINAAISASSTYCTGVCSVYKNGSSYKNGPQNYGTSSGTANEWGVNVLVYLNGSTDYVEIYAYLSTGQALVASSNATYFQGYLVRAA